MENIKFTTDGKKVSVIGKLNNQETIVQEIFVHNGQEFPGGENFVVRSLLDTPAESWKEKELRELKARYERDKNDFDDKIYSLRKRFNEQSQLLRNKLEYIGKALKDADESSFELLTNYVCGNIKYVVVSQGYEIPKLITFDEFNQQYEDKLRLISFFGNDDGSLKYKIGQYYDFSGGNSEFFPFTTYDKAFEKLKDLYQSKTITDTLIKNANELGIELSKEKIEKYKEERISSLYSNIDSHKKSIEDLTEKIGNLDNL